MMLLTYLLHWGLWIIHNHIILLPTVGTGQLLPNPVFKRWNRDVPFTAQLTHEALRVEQSAFMAWNERQHRDKQRACFPFRVFSNSLPRICVWCKKVCVCVYYIYIYIYIYICIYTYIYIIYMYIIYLYIYIYIFIYKSLISIA